MSHNMRPQSLRRREGIQLSYEIPQRIYTTTVYPRRSLNGSSVLIVGHETGLTILWYGGKKIKSSAPFSDLSGGIDLTEDDEVNHGSFADYEEEDEEIDPSRPFRDVLVHHDISIGTGVSHLAVPPLPSERTTVGFPSICETHIVLAAACTDQTLRIIVIPLHPMETLTDVQIIKLGTASMHQDLVADIAITLTADGIGEGDAEKRARSRSRGRGIDSAQEPSASNRKWSLLVVSVSPTGNGLLLAHQLSLEDGIITTEPDEHMPVYRRFLRSPLTNCRIAFNPSPFPAERHSHLLVAIPDASSVQVYDILSQNESLRKRRGSNATLDSVSSATRSPRQSASVGARTLITLLPGFLSQPLEHDLPRRKRVLDAKWIMQGRAIIALLEDGEWGLWDLEAIGPAPASKSNNLVKGQTNVSGIQGGALTKFAFRGNIGSNATSTKRKSGSQSKSSTDSSLAPMTPHTRKERSSGLFKPQEREKASSVLLDQSKGFITVSRPDFASGNQSKGYDESVILSYNTDSTLIPSIQAYWRFESGGRGSFDALGSGRLSTLPTLFTTAEELVALHLLPGVKGSPVLTSAPPAFVSATASKLVLLVPSLSETTMPQSSSSLPMRLTAAKSQTQDQALLASGELDVDGMSRILDKMANSSTEHSTIMNGFGRKSVGFQLTDNGNADDPDDDVDMGTPTQPKSSHSKLTVNKLGSEGRRLFT